MSGCIIPPCCTRNQRSTKVTRSLAQPPSVQAYPCNTPPPGNISGSPRLHRGPQKSKCKSDKRAGIFLIASNRSIILTANWQPP